jgi:hypothetical protein
MKNYEKSQDLAVTPYTLNTEVFSKYIVYIRASLSHWRRSNIDWNIILASQ